MGEPVGEAVPRTARESRLLPVLISAAGAVAGALAASVTLDSGPLGALLGAAVGSIAGDAMTAGLNTLASRRRVLGPPPAAAHAAAVGSVSVGFELLSALIGLVLGGTTLTTLELASGESLTKASEETTLFGGRPTDGPVINPVEVPEVEGMTEEEASATLGDLGLEVTGQQTEPSDSVAVGLATGTDPPAGTQVDEGSGVTLLVSSGSSTAVSVPEVAGLAEADATVTLSDAGLQVSAQTEPSELEPGLATGTDPPPGTQVDEGSAVTLFVSSGPEAE